MADAAKVQMIGDLADLPVGKAQHIAGGLQLLVDDIFGDRNPFILFKKFLQVFFGNPHVCRQLINGYPFKASGDDRPFAFLHMPV